MAEQIAGWEIFAALSVKDEAEFRAKLDAAARYAEQTGKRIGDALAVGFGGGAGSSSPNSVGGGPSPVASSPNAPWPFGASAPAPPRGGSAFTPPAAGNAANQLASAGTQFGLKAAYVLRNAVSGGPAGA